MTIEEFEKKEQIFASEGAEGTRLCTAGQVEAVFLVIRPGKGIASHSLPLPVTFIITSGEGEAVIDGSVYQVKKGDTIFCDPGLEREWKNRGQKDLEVIVLKQMP